MRRPKQKRKEASSSDKRFGAKKLERDLALARAVAPVEVGGGGLTYEEAGEQFGLSKTRVGVIMTEPDMLEVRKDWIKKMQASRRRYGHKFLASEEAGIEAGEPRLLINYSRTMGLDEGPAIDVNIERLEVQVDDETRKMLAASPIAGYLTEDENGPAESDTAKEEPGQAPSSDA